MISGEFERQKFEAWCINNCNYDLAYSDASKRSYRSPSTRRAWIVWQARAKQESNHDTSNDILKRYGIEPEPAPITPEQAGCRKEDTQVDFEIHICNCFSPFSHFDEAIGLQVCDGCGGAK